MLPEALKLGELTIKALSTLRITKSSRNKIAKMLASLYRDLEMLVENGKTILKTLRKHNSGYRINLPSLAEMLEEQKIIIKRINSLLRRRDVQMVLSLRARQIRPLDVLVKDKGSRVTVLLEHVEPHSRRFDYDIFSPTLLLRYRTRIKLPANSAIDRSSKNLRQIEDKLAELRQFIVENFEVHEVM
jgi:hypothetical protein